MALPSLTHGPGDFSPFVNVGAIIASDDQQRQLAAQGIKSKESPAVMQMKQLFFLKKMSMSLENIESILGKSALLEQQRELTDIESKREAGQEKKSGMLEKIAGGVAKLGLKALAGAFLFGLLGGLLDWGKKLKPAFTGLIKGIDWIQTKFDNLGIIVEELTDSKRLGRLVTIIPLLAGAMLAAYTMLNPIKAAGKVVRAGAAVVRGGVNLARKGPRVAARSRLARMKLGRAARSIGRGLKSAGGAVARVASFLPRAGGAIAGVAGVASKIFPITMIAGAIFGTIKGVVEGFKADGIIGALKGGFKGLIDWTVGGIVDLLSDGIGWVLKKMGFEDIGEKFQQFSFSDMIMDVIGGAVEAIKEGIWAIITKLPEWAQKGLPLNLIAAVKPKSVQIKEDQATLVDLGIKEGFGEKLSDEDLQKKAAAQERLKRNVPAAKKVAPEKPKSSGGGWSLPSLPAAEARAANDAAFAARWATPPTTSAPAPAISGMGQSMQASAAGVTYGTESSYSDYGSADVGEDPGLMTDANLSSKDGLMKGVYNAFRKQGFSHSGSLALVGEVGRENGFNPNHIFGFHEDPHNKAVNVGFISWQGSRGKKLQGMLQSAGLLTKGGMQRSQASLDLMAGFLKQEMASGEINKESQKLARDLQGEVDPNNAMDRIGRHFIKWRIDDAKYRAGGIKNRTAFFNKAAALTSGSKGISPGGSMVASASKPAAVAPASASSGPALATASSATSPAALAATSGGNTTNINAPSTHVASAGNDYKAPSRDGALNAVTPPEFAPMVT